MKSLDSGRYAVSISVAVAMLAGCGGSQFPIGATGAMSQVAVRPNSTNYKVVHSFGAAPDGNYPAATLIDVGGTFYGTTVGGGSYICYLGSSSYRTGCGTVFSITRSGVEKVLHNFGSGSDGVRPSSGLIDVGGTLYGTTEYGGAYNHCFGGCGTVFSITPSGTEKVLHSFGNGTDGAVPRASLIEVKGKLYGTTAYGGSYYCTYGRGYACGTVFAITQTGTETVLYTFKGGSGDGAYPQAGLVNVKGTLYGTTERGGEYYGRGTVFSITLSGVEKVLHSFGAGSDGYDPVASLINVKGTLYGTTALGGAMGGCGGYGMCGTVFSITPSGAENVLHDFLGKPDGGSPVAPLIDVNGTLYGTTEGGGIYFCGSTYCGTLFSITPSGAEKVLHSFGAKSDGAVPTAAVTEVNGKLYGTTLSGGKGSCLGGCGTVFKLKP
jgi:uncharacterized repeat protein (TIGR03803 family)